MSAADNNTLESCWYSAALTNEFSTHTNKRSCEEMHLMSGVALQNSNGARGFHFFTPYYSIRGCSSRQADPTQEKQDSYPFVR